MAAENEALIDETQNICCIGAGRLGAFTMLALANQYANKHFLVVDEDANLITRWNLGLNQLPFAEPGLENLVAQHRNQNLVFDNNIVAAVQQCRLIFLAVEMRTKKEGIGEKGKIEVDKWKRMVEIIRDNAQDIKIIVDKSAVPFEERDTILTVLQPGQFQHDVFVNPEFFSQGTSFQTLLNPQRVVFGSRSANANLDLLHQLYHYVPNRVVIQNPRSVDFAKIFSNALLGCLGTIANIGSTFADDLGINIDDVFRVVDGGNRLGHGFLTPNVAIGGPALQTDIAYLAYMAEEFNHKEIATLFKMFIEVNKKRKELFVKKMLDTMVSLKNTTIVILGFAFKEGTEDVSDSPAIYICEFLLKKEKVRLRIHDPIVPGEIILRCLKARGQQDLHVMPLNNQIFQDADAICVMTRAPQYQNLNFVHIRQLMRSPYFFDFTGNVNFDLPAIRQAGFQVYSSGRQE